MAASYIALLGAVLTYIGVSFGLYRLLVRAMEERLKLAQEAVTGADQLAAKLQVIERFYDVQVRMLREGLEAETETITSVQQEELRSTLAAKEELLDEIRRLSQRISTDKESHDWSPSFVELLMLARTARNDWQDEAYVFAKALGLTLMADKHNNWHRETDCAVLCGECKKPVAIWGNPDEVTERKYTCLNVGCLKFNVDRPFPEQDEQIVEWDPILFGPTFALHRNQ